jgi:branched-chain amino acid transport system substrate-binding protein
MAKVHELPINDMMTKNDKLREDGRVMRDMYLAESKGKDDIYRILATVPADQAWRPLKEGKCPLIKN